MWVVMGRGKRKDRSQAGSVPSAEPAWTRCQDSEITTWATTGSPWPERLYHPGTQFTLDVSCSHWRVMLELSLSVHVDVASLPCGVAGRLHLQPLAASVHVPLKGHLKKEHKSWLPLENHPLIPSDSVTQPTPGGLGARKEISEPMMAISWETQPCQCPWPPEGQCCVETHRYPEREDLPNSCHSSFSLHSVQISLKGCFHKH